MRLADGTMAPLSVPGNLRLTGDFRLATGMVADLVVQGFDRCNAIQAAGNSGQFVLHGDVPVQLRALPFVTDREQPASGSLRPIPGDGYATVVSNPATGDFTIQRFDTFGGLQGGAINTPRDPNPPNLVLTPDGTPLGSQQLFADGITPSIAGLADGGLVIAWFAQRSVNAQRFGPDGSPLGPIVNLTSTAAAAPSVVALPWGGFLIGWPTVTDGKPQDLMRFFDAQGLLGN